MISDILPAGVAAVEETGEIRDPSLLPEEAAALGRVSELRRHEFALGRTCARRALAEIGLPPAPILPGSHRQPLWPAGVVGSITHCPGYCAAAVAWRGRFVTVGIDAEIHDELPSDVLDLVALPEERRSLSALSGAGVCWERLLFSAKESVYKAWFQIAERWMDFQDVLITIDPGSRRFDARLLIPGVTVDGRVVTSFDGRFLVERGAFSPRSSSNSRDRAGSLRPTAVTLLGHSDPSLSPHDSPVDRNGGDLPWIERHSSTPLGRQQRLGLEVAHPEEDQLAAVDSLEAHPAEPDVGRPTGVLGEDDLIGRQGHGGSVPEDDGRSRRPIAQDGELRDDLGLTDDAGAGHELDEQRKRVHSSHSFQ